MTAVALHPAAWTAWLAACVVGSFALSNPLTLALVAGAVAVVHLSAPRPSPTFRTMVWVGAGLLALRLAFVASLPNPGSTVLWTLPRAQLPRWLGGFGLGGAVTAEVVAESATDGLRLVVLLAAFAVFNERVEPSALLRMVPSALREAGVVVGVALAFVPGLLRTLHDVRDAQRLRGERGIRTLAPSLAVPVLGLTLERAFTLAESMDARGYGRMSASIDRRGSLFGLAVIVLGLALWVGGLPGVGTAVVASGGVAVALSLRSRGTATRLATRGVSPPDVAVAFAVTAAVAAAATTAAWSAYPVLHAPPFGWTDVLPALLLTAPAFVERRP